MYFWFDWVKTEYPLPKSHSINRNEQIKKIKNLRKIMITTAIPLWILSAILLTPIMMDYYELDEPDKNYFRNNYFEIGMISGILGIVIIAIGIMRLFTIQQTLDMYYFAEKQLQFS